MNLSEWMKVQALRDHDVAQRVGCTRQTISRLRRKRINPSVSMINKIISASDGVVTASALVACESQDAPKNSAMSSAGVTQGVVNKH